MKMKCCSGMCVDKLTVDQVMAERTEQKKYGQDGRRSTLRSFLEDNANPHSKLGYKLHPSDDRNVRLCASDFGTLRGYGKGYTYITFLVRSSGSVQMIVNSAARA